MSRENVKEKVSPIEGDRNREFVRTPRKISNRSSVCILYIYTCVCVRSRGDNGISGRAGSLLNIRPLGVLYTYGSLGTGYQMARGVASVTLLITNLEIAVPLSAMN